MAYMFTEKQQREVIESWGDDFYNKLLQDIDIYAEKWQLSDFELVEYYSINAILFCKSELYGECVLKIGGDWQDYEFAAEYNTLREYNSRKYVKAYESDIDIANRKKIMLIERVRPGKRLGEEQSFEKRLAVFSELFNGLHIESANPDLYTSYVKWVCNAAESVNQREDSQRLRTYMQKAKEMCLELIKTYDRQMLLHIDIFGDNIVSYGDGYKIIDPKGIIGDPIFETGQFIFAECCERGIEPDKTSIIFDYLEKSLNIPNLILKQCFYIETVRFLCHETGDDGPSDWDIDMIKFAETFM